MAKRAGTTTSSTRTTRANASTLDVGRRTAALKAILAAKPGVNLDSDVPEDEIERLAGHSYALVCEGLTRKQKAELAALS